MITIKKAEKIRDELFPNIKRIEDDWEQHFNELGKSVFKTQFSTIINIELKIELGFDVKGDRGLWIFIEIYHDGFLALSEKIMGLTIDEMKNCKYENFLGISKIRKYKATFSRRIDEFVYQCMKIYTSKIISVAFDKAKASAI